MTSISLKLSLFRHLEVKMTSIHPYSVQPPEVIAISLIFTVMRLLRVNYFPHSTLKDGGCFSVFI